MSDRGNISHVTVGVHTDLSVRSSIDYDRPGEPTCKGELVCLFVGDVQVSFGWADALANIDAMAGWLARLREQVAALPEREAAPVIFDTSDGASFDPAPAVAGLTPDAGDHFVREAVA